MLQATSEALRMLERGLRGYAFVEKGPCHLLLSDGEAVKVFAVGTDIAPRFECFSLAMEADEMPSGSVIDFVTPMGGRAMGVLLREEYIEPNAEEDAVGRLGQRPWMTQSAVKPGNVPLQAWASCLVAYGLLVEGVQERLAITAGWFPYDVEVTTDEALIAELLSESEVLPVEQYLQKYHAS